MAEKSQTSLTPTYRTTDPFALLRQMTSELDRAFDDATLFRWPSFQAAAIQRPSWSPKIDVFERDNQLVTRVDLPGMKKEDVTVEIADGHLALKGERKKETEEKKDNFYRSEREYGSFYRSVPLPEGVNATDVHASFVNGVLEVTVPLPKATSPAPTKIQIQDAASAPLRH